MKEKVTVYLPLRLRARLRTRANKEKRTISAIVQLALERYLEEEK